MNASPDRYSPRRRPLSGVSKIVRLAVFVAVLGQLLPVNAYYETSQPSHGRSETVSRLASPPAPGPEPHPQQLDRRFVKTIGLPFDFGASHFISLSGTAGPEKTGRLPLPFGTRPALAQTSALTITKSDLVDPVNPGQLLTYRLLLTNTGGMTVTGLTLVTETIPANTTCADLDVSSANWFLFKTACKQSNQPKWGTLTAIVPNEVVTLTLVVTVTEPLPDQTIITNLATSYAITNAGSILFGANIVTTTVNAPAWTITKTAEPDPVQPGQALTYTINVTNTGHLATSGPYTVSDRLPEFTNLVTATIPFTTDGQIVSWVFTDSLAVDLGQTLTLVVTPTVPLTDGLDLVNDDYRVTGGNVFSDGIGAPVSVKIDAPATLTLTKTAEPEPVQAGDVLTYTITVTNSPSSLGPALAVVVTDTLPSRTFLQAMGFVPPFTGTTTPPVTGSKVITWSLFQPIPRGDAAQLTATVQITSPEYANTIITNTYSVTASNISSVVSGPPATSTISSTNIITLSKSVQPEAVIGGEVVTYTIVVTNVGNGIASVTLTDTLDPAFTPTVITFPTFILPGRDRNGVSTPETLTFTATTPMTQGVYFNPEVRATYNGAETVITDTAPVTVSVATLQIAKSDEPDPVGVGQPLAYTLTYSNVGAAPANNAVITDTLDPNVTFITSTLGLPDNVAGNDLGWDVGTVPPNSGPISEVVTVQVSLDLDDLDVISNTATTLSDEATITDTGVITTLVYAPVLNVVKFGDPDPTVQAGGLLTYTIRYTNTGHYTATGVIVTDTLDANVSLVSASPPTSTQVGQTVTWLGLPDLPPLGGSGTITVTVQVNAPLANGTLLTNTAGITSSQRQGDLVDPPLTTTVQSQPVWAIAKAGSADPVQAGGRLTYTITYTNTGNETAAGVVVTDTLDSNVTLVSVTPPTATQIGQTLVWTRDTVSPQDGSQIITIVVDVNSPLDNGTVLTNTVVVTSSRGISDTAVLTTTVSSAPVMHLAKSDGADPVNPGDTLVYTISYSNTGNADATGVIITDTFDSNTTFVTSSPAPDGGLDPIRFWGPLSVPADSLATIVVTVAVSAPLADLTVLTNVVTMTTPATGTLTATENTLVRAADVSVSKTVSPDPALAGDPIVYTITYRNAAGAPTAANVTITDTLPISVNVTGIISSASHATFSGSSGRTFVWSDPSVPGGSVRTITITGTVITGPWPSTLLDMTNLVTVAMAVPEVNQADNDFPLTSQGGPNLPASVTVVGVPDTAPVPGPIALTATVEDAFGNRVLDGTPVDFSASLGSITPPSTTTGNGTASASISSNVSGPSTVTATAESVVGTTVVTFTAGGAVRFEFDPIADQVAGVPFAITITARDGFDNLVTDFNQTVNLADGTGTLAPTTVAFVNGVGSTNVSVTQATPADMITATFGITTGVSNAFAVSAGPPTQASLVVLTPQQCGGTAPVGATVTDAFGNLVAGAVVTLTTTAGGISPANPTTDGNGEVSATLTAPTGPPPPPPNATVAIDVNGAGPEDSQLVTFSTPGLPSDLSLSGAPGTIPLFGSSTLTALLQDCVGTPISGTNIALSIVNAAFFNNTLALVPQNGNTNASGIFNSTLGADVFGGQATIQASGAGLSATTVITIDGAPALNAFKLVEPNTVTVTAGTRLTYTVIMSNSGNAAASQVVITDSIPSGATYVPGSAAAVLDEPGSGPTPLFISGPSPLVVNVGTITPTGVVTFTFQVTATSGTTITNVATVGSTQLADRDSNPVATGVEGVGRIVYLPLVLKNFPEPPDLVVDQIQFFPSNPTTGQDVVISVTIRNAGNIDIAASSPFWVDLYITTSPVSPGVNTRWNDVPGALGVAWKVYGLNAGQSSVLTNLAPNDALNCNNFSNFTPPVVGLCSWPLNSNRFSAPGSYFLVALVDSFAEDASLSDGNVTETNEANNLSPSETVVVGAGTSGAESAETAATPVSDPIVPGAPRPALLPRKEE